jgi:hypothetical protein
LRDAVNFVQIEQAKRFTHRALPIAPAEARVFQDTIDLWDEMRQGYLRCLDAGGEKMTPECANARVCSPSARSPTPA